MTNIMETLPSSDGREKTQKPKRARVRFAPSELAVGNLPMHDWTWEQTTRRNSKGEYMWRPIPVLGPVLLEFLEELTTDGKMTAEEGGSLLDHEYLDG